MKDWRGRRRIIHRHEHLWPVRKYMYRYKIAYIAHKKALSEKELWNNVRIIDEIFPVRIKRDIRVMVNKEGKTARMLDSSSGER